MSIWKYNTAKQSQEMLLSLNLLAPEWSRQKQLATLYSLSNHQDSHYQLIASHKKNGDIRQIYAPDRLLKQVQRNLLKHLLNQPALPPYATAYHKGATLAENARPHLGQAQVLKLDIEDFFGSIQFNQVMASAFPGHLYPPDVQMLLTSLCCFREALPQGAPTSPVISNMVMRSFDDYMGQWCKNRHINYTRYCDDMTFSGDFQPRTVINKVRSFLAAYQFELNDAKTQCLKPYQCQLVTGVVVNDRLQVTRHYRRQLRQEVFYCQKFGIASHLARRNKRLVAQIGEDEVEHYKTRLLGKISFVLQVNPEDDQFYQMRQLVLNL